MSQSTAKLAMGARNASKELVLATLGATFAPAATAKALAAGLRRPCGDLESFGGLLDSSPEHFASQESLASSLQSLCRIVAP